MPTLSVCKASGFKIFAKMRRERRNRENAFAIENSPSLGKWAKGSAEEIRKHSPTRKENDTEENQNEEKTQPLNNRCHVQSLLTQINIG